MASSILAEPPQPLPVLLTLHQGWLPRSGRLPALPYPEQPEVIIGYSSSFCPVFLQRKEKKDRIAGGPAILAFIALAARCRDRGRGQRVGISS